MRLHAKMERTGPAVMQPGLCWAASQHVGGKLQEYILRSLVTSEMHTNTHSLNTHASYTHTLVGKQTAIPSKQ